MVKDVMLFRIAVLAFSAALAIAFEQPYFLGFLLLMLLFKQKSVAKTVEDKLDELNTIMALIMTHILKDK